MGVNPTVGETLGLMKFKQEIKNKCDTFLFFMTEQQYFVYNI